MLSSKSQLRSKSSPARLRAFEEARKAVIKLKALKPLLSSADEETLAILMDKELMTHLKKSLSETAKGKLEPLHNILK